MNPLTLKLRNEFLSTFRDPGSGTQPAFQKASRVEAVLISWGEYVTEQELLWKRTNTLWLMGSATCLIC